MRINKYNPKIKSFTNEYKSSIYNLQIKMFCVGILLAENLPCHDAILNNYNKMMNFIKHYQIQWIVIKCYQYTICHMPLNELPSNYFSLLEYIFIWVSIKNFLSIQLSAAHKSNTVHQVFFRMHPFSTIFTRTCKSWKWICKKFDTLWVSSGHLDFIKNSTTLI